MRVAYQARSKEALQEEHRAVQAEYDALKSRNLKLNMSRGKPSRAQLDMVSDIMNVFQFPEDFISDGIDVRNYGELSGLPAAKRLFAEILGCKPEECFIGGNASLTLMYDTISKAFTHGLQHSTAPWCKLDTVKWLCPSPGYDRHFKITQSFGCEMITVPMTPTGPDMDLVESLVKDPAVKEFASTSKITFPGAGISVMATSEANQKYMQKLLSIQTISYDKVNQQRHVLYLKDKAHTLELMKKHAAHMAPKFQCVLRHLDGIADLGIATWERPRGGYFVSCNTAPGLAKRTLALCSEAGVTMTGAGATFPYGIDPQDSNIRIAPSLPPVEELELAMQVFTTSLRLAALEQLLA